MLNKLMASLCLLCVVTFVNAQEDDEKNDENRSDDSKRPSWSVGLPERTQKAELNKPEFKPEMDTDMELDMSEFGLKRKAEIELDLPINDTIAAKVEEPVEELIEQPAEPEPALDSPVVEVVAQPEPTDLQEPDSTVDEPVLMVNEPAEGINEKDTIATEPDNAITTDLDNVVTAESEKEDTMNAATELRNEVVSAPVEEKNEPITQAPVEEETVTIPVEQSIASIEPPINSQVEDPAEAAAEQAVYKWNILKREPVKYPVKAAIDNLEGWVDVEVTISPDGQVVSASPIKYSRRGRLFGKPAVRSVTKWLFQPPNEIGITENISRVYKIEFEL